MTISTYNKVTALVLAIAVAAMVLVLPQTTRAAFNDVSTSGIIGGTTDIITAASDVTTFVYDGTDWRVIARIDTSDDLN